ncbi:Cd2+/Zn2+-exporting ATPase [Hydrogenispora ethanolica]|uniref:Cd(2+)-exporting ATPase n=1 Tax=Hydrogenispora ethanolica TaxID=1082276 RepID=A0A4R1SBY1_HYDET|nr:heavy metal translocating P-type ATPase [Hydrogenispora ethanolica]TCL76939.1 Cd2+/Zn2+-exporting ATPase [Hydrogenispora ethanolica]
MTTNREEEVLQECSHCSHCAHCAEIVEGAGEPADDHGPDRRELIQYGAAVLLFVVALLGKFSFGVEFGLYSVSYLLIGGTVLWEAVRNIRRGRIFDENFLMSLATLGAFALGEFPEGVAVMLFYRIGEFFQELAVKRSRRSIAALMDIRPDFANLKTDAGIERVAPEAVAVGATIVIRPGEKVPLDGTVIDGASTLDTSALTGEAVPREVAAGGAVLSGSINQTGLLTVEVAKSFGQSTVARILDLVQNAGAKKAPTENFITKFARYYTPAVVLAAVILALVPPLILPGAGFAAWINRALVFLVVSCPCALVLSIPLSFFGGIGAASRNGILIKGGNYLEALNRVDTVVFDKTGTLTQGVFQVVRLEPSEPFGEAELLEHAAYAESFSSHPIALSIRQAYGREIDPEAVSDYREISGHGIRVRRDGRTILAGNSRLLEREAISCPGVEAQGTVVHVAVDGRYAGWILIADAVKEDSSGAIAALKAAGVRKLAMLTGDSRAVAETVGRSLGLDEVHAELLPDQKVARLEALERQKSGKGTLVFVGDGINDAPVLARADVGVAMGGLGSDAAIEAADVVLMTDEPSKLATAIRIAKRTRHIVAQNIGLALGVKGLVLILGVGGVATMWEAVFADVGVAVLAILNAIRVQRARY